MTDKTTSLKDKLQSDTPIFGIALYLGSVAAIEIAGNWGLDFAFIDSEHTTSNIDQHVEKLVMASLIGGIAPIVRVRGTIGWEIRKSLEFGAAGVMIPQVHTASQMQAIVQAGRFPPLGRRGADGSVRAAGYGGPGFDWSSYIEKSNSEALIIPMAESYEFFDNIDEILAVEGIDIVSFGPLDYALSRQISTASPMTNPEIVNRLEELVQKCHARGIKVMAPCVPPDGEAVARLMKTGVDMIILGTDVMFLNQGCQRMIDIAKAALG
ncbi:HpcH/HpaI aldolase family protein [Mesorhizobium sp. CO1-1-8]|uniref:HpcH/HpaI aldolase family protein n=1 Tax=Mesorhizobium sp. CO1-1-8 TaxID=2876631 RepID=UPI001CD05E3D|nr:aldolase/citrate lyase family protein [Mesorhizobium sp. CO1-1-8]MBZ9772188.1 2,4-dihydroxyhept-2-ene-1,7-dioic acid aldolase [Mesorhizobium sp. CO1-1-8]